MAIDIQKFYSNFSSNKDFALSLPVLWSVNFPKEVKYTDINTVLTESNIKWSAMMDPSRMTKDGNLLVAQEVEIPSEKAEFSPIETSKTMGGFLPAYGMNKRVDFLSRTVKINFIETLLDIEHNYFRPWMIALAMQGLIEHGPDLKCDIQVEQFSNVNNQTPFKGYVFKKAYPVAIEGFTLKYSDTDFRIKSVTFSYYDYEKLQARTGVELVGPPSSLRNPNYIPENSPNFVGPPSRLRNPPVPPISENSPNFVGPPSNLKNPKNNTANKNLLKNTTVIKNPDGSITATTVQRIPTSLGKEKGTEYASERAGLKNKLAISETLGSKSISGVTSTQKIENGNLVRTSKWSPQAANAAKKIKSAMENK